jgi:hypothetical protein
MARQRFTRTIQTRAISSVYGKIEQLLLAYPSGLANVNKENVLERYGAIFEAFNDRVTFVVMGHFGEKSNLKEQANKAFREALLERQIDPEQHLVFCHTPFAGSLCKKTHDLHSEYVQDPFLVMETEVGQVVLLEPIRQANPENINLAEQLAASVGYFTQPSHVGFEGGNFLIGDDFVLVGKNILIQNQELATQMDAVNPQKWLEAYIRKTLGVRYLIWVGTETELKCGTFHSTGSPHMQPFFHVDLFVTLLGKTNNGKECLLLARIDLEEVDDVIDHDLEMLRKINEALDHIENELEQYGSNRPGPLFEVLRNEIGGKVMQGNKGRYFVPYACNNAQVEQFQNIRRIYLPGFPDKQKLEKKLKEKLLRIGFSQPVMIYNVFEEYAKNGGSLHCISSVLSRSTT